MPEGNGLLSKYASILTLTVATNLLKWNRRLLFKPLKTMRLREVKPAYSESYFKFNSKEENTKKYCITWWKDHYYDIHEYITWCILPVVEIIANLIIAVSVSLQRSFKETLTHKQHPWKDFRLKINNRNPWLAYQHCVSLQGPLVFQHHRDALAETNTYMICCIHLKLVCSTVFL